MRACGLASTGSAQAYEVRGYEWPGPRITYWVVHSEVRHAADYGVRAWNRADVGIVFRRAHSRVEADVLVTHARSCGGSAHAGYYGPEVQTRVTLGTDCPDRRLTSIVAAHDFGHVLGLGHETRVCALMNPTFSTAGTPSRCPPRSLRHWYREPLRIDDIRGARSRYRVPGF